MASDTVQQAINGFSYHRKGLPGDRFFQSGKFRFSWKMNYNLYIVVEVFEWEILLFLTPIIMAILLD